MKVILAGFPKTGTKTMADALRTLGYDVYDFMENFWFFEKQWNKILTTGGTVRDFKEMYENVDAVTDNPVYFFWEQIHQAFPDALIILTVRDENSWIKSAQKQIDMLDSDKYLRLIWSLSPKGRAYRKQFHTCCMALLGISVPHAWSKMHFNQMMSLNRDRMHNEYVLKHAPKDKLLVFHPREGWEPLCKFLGKEVPEIPFPHKNIGGSVIKMLLKEDEIMQTLSRHTMVAGALWLSVGSAAMFFIGRIVVSKWKAGAFACFNIF